MIFKEIVFKIYLLFEVFHFVLSGNKSVNRLIRNRYVALFVLALPYELEITLFLFIKNKEVFFSRPNVFFTKNKFFFFKNKEV